MKWIRLLLFLLLCAAAAASGQLYPPGAWYESLQKPAITPPSWAFGAVWTPLYVMIAVAGWLLWERAPRSAAMKWWFVQLALNALWTCLFFGLQRPDLALMEIVFLWISIAATIVAAWKPCRPAALLLAPYLAWVAFATVLNEEFWRLN